MSTFKMMLQKRRAFRRLPDSIFDDPYEDIFYEPYRRSHAVKTIVGRLLAIAAVTTFIVVRILTTPH